jgi:hypothetical protein
VKKRTNDDRQSRQIKDSGRTYFLDIEKTRDSKPYLGITESRKRALKKQGGCKEWFGGRF